MRVLTLALSLRTYVPTNTAEPRLFQTERLPEVHTLADPLHRLVQACQCRVDLEVIAPGLFAMPVITVNMQLRKGR
jgi:hypothetical protein